MFFRKKNEKIGKLGEKLAVKYLKQKKYKIVETNFQNCKGIQLGEIDIIAKEKNNHGVWEIVFVEVKSRMANASDIQPESSINWRKLQKLQKISQIYIDKNDLWNYEYRFDAIAILFSGNLKILEIKHIKNIYL